MSYKNIIDAIKYSRVKDVGHPTFHMRLVETVEFFPEEGKYHYDGHRACRARFSPKESRKMKGVCEKCGNPLTIGVLSQIEELADRPAGYIPDNAVPFRSLVPLEEIIGDALGIGPRTKGVTREYQNLIKVFGNEFKILLDASLGEVAKSTLPEIAEALRRVRVGELVIEPGYDGEYGKVRIFKEGEKRSTKTQSSLF